MGKRHPAGTFDRHVLVQTALETTDAAGDTVIVWQVGARRWMERRDRQSFREVSAAHEVLRDSDTLFIARDKPWSQAIAPESHRFFYQRRVYEIVGIGQSNERTDCRYFLCAYRPDGRGPRGPTDGSQP